MRQTKCEQTFVKIDPSIVHYHSQTLTHIFLLSLNKKMLLVYQIIKVGFGRDVGVGRREAAPGRVELVVITEENHVVITTEKIWLNRIIK